MSTRHQHHYQVGVEWTGNTGSGTRSYRGYDREHVVRVAGKPELIGSSDPAYRGDATRHNPEDMLVAALSACHMLSYLHAASVAGVVVTAYVDEAEGWMETGVHGVGRFVEVVLRPLVTISADSDPARASTAHDDAHHACFIANSVNFPVRCVPRIVVAAA
jgi:organic hydroperoxide reductase OsmC/OhrA